MLTYSREIGITYCCLFQMGAFDFLLLFSSSLEKVLLETGLLK